MKLKNYIFAFLFLNNSMLAIDQCALNAWLLSVEATICSVGTIVGLCNRHKMKNQLIKRIELDLALQADTNLSGTMNFQINKDDIKKYEMKVFIAATLPSICFAFAAGISYTNMIRDCF